ncbi:uncharacterized protein LOC127257618 [Andrographis paniculata]|uniref:uncharacterized protein LOC127257618 n=1 Tax=Andrographis paniculata TaxID=175694 RepID=UPI0021E93848|nr:uncharacterized protein LOC127257618 [Andrographis paniculata]
MTEDCIKYAQRCEACQRHGPSIRIPAEEMHAVLKPWPFRGWAVDIIGKIHPPSSRRQSFILLATDYFTNWIEAVPLANVTYQETITADQCTVFTSDRVAAFDAQYGIALLHSSLYYAQANGQAEAANKVLIGVIKKAVEDNPRRWHEVLGEALWACRK